MSEKKFSKKHEWVSLEGDVATVGITKHATELLGDIVFAEVPEAGKSVEKEGQAAVVESTKAASDVYSPISGEITEGNKSIVDDPSSINKDPEGVRYILVDLIFLLFETDKSAFSTISGLKIIPGPPPKGSSSTLFLLSIPKSCKFIVSILKIFSFNALPIKE